MEPIRDVVQFVVDLKFHLRFDRHASSRVEGSVVVGSVVVGSVVVGSVVVGTGVVGSVVGGLAGVDLVAFRYERNNFSYIEIHLL